jgi:hypothetical protein
LDEYIENQKNIPVAASEEFSEKESGWFLFDLMFFGNKHYKIQPY